MLKCTSAQSVNSLVLAEGKQRKSQLMYKQSLVRMVLVHEYLAKESACVNGCGGGAVGVRRGI